MRWGYNTNGFAHHRLEDTLIILAELGYESVAITLDYHALNPFSPDAAKEVALFRELLQRLQLGSVVETGSRFLLNPRHKHQPTLISAEPTLRQQRLEFLQKAVDIAQELGSDAVSFWSGAADSATSKEEIMHWLVTGCQQLADYAQPKNIRLAFEPEPGMFIDRMEAFAQLHKRVARPNFGLTLDIGHLHCQGELPIAEHVLRWRDWLWNIHIEDMKHGIHDHLFFGEGEIDFKPVLMALKEIDYAGGVHVELSRHSHDAVEVARQALAFLRRLV